MIIQHPKCAVLTKLSCREMASNWLGMSGLRVIAQPAGKPHCSGDGARIPCLFSSPSCEPGNQVLVSGRMASFLSQVWKRISSKSWSCMVEARASAALTLSSFIMGPLGGNDNAQPFGRMFSWLFQMFPSHIRLLPVSTILCLFPPCLLPFSGNPCPGLELPPCHRWLVLAPVLTPGKMGVPGKIIPAAKSCGQWTLSSN